MEYLLCAHFVVDDKILSSSRKHIICETTLLKQVYDKLDVAGKSGLTIIELTRQLGLQKLDGRTLLKNLCRKGLAVCTLHDMDKSAIHRFVLLVLQGGHSSLKDLESSYKIFFHFSRPWEVTESEFDA